MAGAEMNSPLGAAAGAGGAESQANGGLNGAGAMGKGATSTAAGAGSSAIHPGRGTVHVHTGDINYVWNHGQKCGKQGFKCFYCGITYSGGGATRFMQHLSGLGNQVKPCDHVPHEVRDAMRSARAEKYKNKMEVKKRRAMFEYDLLQELQGPEPIHVGPDGMPNDEEIQLQYALELSRKYSNYQQEVETRGGTFEHGSGSGSANRCVGPMDKFVCKRSDGSAKVQQRIDVSMDKTKIEKVGQAWAKWFHANDIPGRKINCYYFRAALRLSMTLGLVEPLPKGSDIDGRYLDANCMQMEEFVDSCKGDWDKFGVTIMCDSWTGPTRMSIINFMVYCNTQVFFHKSINASNKMQNADYLCTEIKKVIDEVGCKRVVQIVTDNGANYKKACANVIEDYPHIIWQPCAAHTINLILKDIGEFPEVDKVVRSAKRISRFFYNHNRLHDEMKKKIGGELIRPNATRFGTVFIFLRSFHDRKDKFQEWMVSPEWKNSEWRDLRNYEFAQNKLTSNKWWSKVKDIIDIVEPLYTVLRYADQQRIGTMSGFKSRMQSAGEIMLYHLGYGSAKCEKYMRRVAERVNYLYDGTLMKAASILDPETHYSSDKKVWEDDDIDYLMSVIEKIADSPREGMRAMEQFELFRTNQGRFGGKMARAAASELNASTWWYQYGGEVKILQKYAMRIVDQCVSSSGCERNWSTFALIHTKVRNRLSYVKLHKLVYTRYNLRLRIQQHELEREQSLLDPCSMIMDATLYDEENPMMDWLNNSMSATAPVLDDENHPSQFVVEEIRKEKGILKRKQRKLVTKLSRKKMRRVSSLTKLVGNKKGKKAPLNEEDEFVDTRSDADSENELEFEETSEEEEEDQYSEDMNDGEEEGGGEEVSVDKGGGDGEAGKASEEEGDGEVGRAGEEEGDAEAGGASEEEEDDEQEKNERRRSRRGNRKKLDPNSVYY